MWSTSDLEALCSVIAWDTSLYWIYPGLGIIIAQIWIWSSTKQNKIYWLKHFCTMSTSTTQKNRRNVNQIMKFLVTFKWMWIHSKLLRFILIKLRCDTSKFFIFKSWVFGMGIAIQTPWAVESFYSAYILHLSYLAVNTIKVATFV